MNKRNQYILALFIINKGEFFSNSYDLCKVLSWRFKIINCSEIIEGIKTKKFVTSEYVNGIGSFKLTHKGYEFIDENRETFFRYLQDEYPNEDVIDFLDS